MPEMRRVFCFSLAALLIGACSDDAAPRWAPNLIGLELLDPASGAINLLPEADAGVPPALSPLASIRATFDALLDPSKVQDLSGASPAPGRGLAKLQWESAGGITELGLLADYNPSKRQNFGPAPTVTFTAPVAFPAGVRVTLVMSRERITDKQGRPYVGLAGASFETQPFAATVALPQGALPATFSARVAFSSLPAAVPAGAVRVFAGDVEVPIEVAVEPSARNVWVVSPLGEGVPWGAGPHRLVLLPQIITDTFGIALPPGAYDFPFLIGGEADARTNDGGSSDSASDTQLNDTL